MEIYEFSSYKNYIVTYIKNLPSGGRGELSRIAKVIDIHNTTLSQIVNGEKNLSLDQGLKLSCYLSLNKEETDFLFTLINYERSNDLDLKDYLLKKINKIRREVRSEFKFKNKTKKTELDFESRAIFYSSWDYTALRVLSAINSGQSLEELIEKLPISRLRAKEVLNFLVNRGLCTLIKNKYYPKNSHIHLEHKDSLINSHRMNWKAKAIERMGRIEENELIFSAPMSISYDDFDDIRLSINRLIEKTIRKAKDSNAEVGVCLNIDWFKFSK